jgi:hypothetical protein
MAEQAPTLTRHDLEAKIVKRCWEDEEFREEFSADPAGAFVRYLELPATSLPKIVVHGEPSGTWHIVLPQKPLNSNELSEQDLERVAAGVLSQVYVVTATASISAVTIAASAGLSATLQKGW